jgi:hypothetical protein
MRTMEGERASFPPAGAAADELELLARELVADPCGVVRRACQRADYDLAAAPSTPDKSPSS